MSLLVDDNGRDLSEFFNVWLHPERLVNESDQYIKTPQPDVLLIGNKYSVLNRLRGDK